MSHPPSDSLQRHRLRHLPSLRIDPIIFEGRFAAGCSMANCNAGCCRYGVMVDPEERKRILAHAELVKRHMEPHMDRNEAEWFDHEGEIDTDFPSGWAVGTGMRGYGCVFLDSAGRCVLQRAAEMEGMPKYALKPFFCFAYPITIEEGVLTLEDPNLANRAECCSLVPEGTERVIDVCREELEFALGAEGFEELKAREREARGATEID